MPTQRKLETILLANKLVSEEQLGQIIHYAQAVGIDLYEAVLQRKIASPEAVTMAYAESQGLPFVSFDHLSIDEEVVSRIDPMTARQYSVVPISIEQGHVLAAATKPLIPDAADALRMIFNLPVRCAICTPAELNAAIAKYYPRHAAKVAGIESGTVPLPVPKERPKPAPPMGDEEKKDRAMKTFMAFNFTLAFVYFVFPYLPFPRWMVNSSSVLLLLGVVLGGIAAGVTWKVWRR